MKYKNKLVNLKARQAWYDSRDNNYKHACKRPGSQKK